MSKFNITQDFTNVTWTKKPNPKLLPKTTIINNKQKNLNIGNNTVQKINDDIDIVDNIKPVLIDKLFSKQIIENRRVKNLTQADLAKQLSIPVAIIKDYENGKGIQNGTYVSKLKKFLNIHK